MHWRGRQCARMPSVDGAARYYLDGSYWEHRATSDSSYKVNLAFSLLDHSGVKLRRHLRVAEVGCGQGAFLVPLASALESKGVDATMLGLDISPHAIDMANSRAERIQFAVGSAADVPRDLDIIFCMDVVEHVEQPYEFLRSLAGKSTYVILHLPLEHSIGHLLLRKPSASYAEFRHINFYSWETAQVLLSELPFRLVAHQFSAASMETIRIVPGLAKKLTGLVRLGGYRLAPKVAPVVGGGSVLLLLENKDR